MLLLEAFSEFFTKVAFRPALVILLTCQDKYKNKLNTVHLQDKKNKRNLDYLISLFSKIFNGN